MLPDDGRVVSNFIIQALQGKDLTVYGDGKQTRSFCYVDDLIEALIRFMDSSDDITGPINLGNPKEFSILELAHMVIELTGSHSKIVFRPLPEDDPIQRQPDIRLAKKIIEWEPEVSLRDGLKETIRYFRKLFSNSGEIT